ncbi:MAG: hypothetical protein Q4C00_06685 [Bacillota bacterium]|nr:hypothetical protein [Bacillota bacterium]
MKPINRKVKYFVIISAIMVFAIVAVLFLLGVFKSDDTDIVVDEYTNNLSKIESPYDWEDITNSESAYLVDPGFEVTESNINSSLRDFFSAPSRLYIEDTYKCDNLTVNAAFGDIFSDISFVTCSEQDFNAVDPTLKGLVGEELRKTVKHLHTKPGYIMLILYEGHSYIRFILCNNEEFMNDADVMRVFYFYTEEDLSAPYELAKENMMPYAMKVQQFELE